MVCRWDITVPIKVNLIHLSHVYIDWGFNTYHLNALQYARSYREEILACLVAG